MTTVDPKDIEKAAKYLEWAADRVMGDFYRESVEMREIARRLTGQASQEGPREGENGQRVAPQPCDRYRAYERAPGYCWCGWMEHEHGRP